MSFEKYKALKLKIIKTKKCLTFSFKSLVISLAAKDRMESRTKIKEKRLIKIIGSKSRKFDMFGQLYGESSHLLYQSTSPFLRNEFKTTFQSIVKTTKSNLNLFFLRFC